MHTNISLTHGWDRTVSHLLFLVYTIKKKPKKRKIILNILSIDSGEEREREIGGGGVAREG